MKTYDMIDFHLYIHSLIPCFQEPVLGVVESYRQSLQNKYVRTVVTKFTIHPGQIIITVLYQQ